MGLRWQDLSEETQDYLRLRFSRHGLPPEEAYEKLIPEQVKQKGSDFIAFYMQHKDISHIYPSSLYPDIKNDLNNVFLEDSEENQARGNNIASPEEVQASFWDNIRDVYDQDFNDDGIVESFLDFFRN